MPDFENFPDDDEVALLQFIEEFSQQYKESLEKLPDDADSRSIGIEFMNNVLAAAHALGIQDFNSWRLPEWKDAYDEINKFHLFTKQFSIKVQIKNARVKKALSVSLDADTKRKIHTYITTIRDILERSDIDERKKNSLFAKLNRFAADVDRARTPFDNAMAFIIDAADVAKKVGESLNPVNELIKRISELLGHAKDLEGDAKLPPPAEHKRIEGPKEPKSISNNDLDEDIPF